MAGIELDHVTKSFAGDVLAVDDVSLTIEEGEFLVLVGPSGCGKSTLLRMIAGLEEVSDGTISIGDVDVTDLPPGERDIAMVFQNYALYPHMTVREDLGFGLSVRRTPRREIAGRVTEVATLPAGTLWIPLSQPTKHWIQAVLGENPYLPFHYHYDVVTW